MFKFMVKLFIYGIYFTAGFLLLAFIPNWLDYWFGFLVAIVTRRCWEVLDSVPLKEEKDNNFKSNKVV